MSATLATQVLGALHELLRGLHAADAERAGQSAAQQKEHLYEGLLSVLLRLVFLLYAEDRGADPVARRWPGAHPVRERLRRAAAACPPLARIRRATPTRWMNAGAPGRGCWRCSRWCTTATAPAGSAAAAASCSTPQGFPFLQGQDRADAPLAPASVTDGCILRVLNLLLVLKGERLSYRTLDVEQIGSVYETVMGFEATTMQGPALAIIAAGKHDRTPVFVDLTALLAAKPGDRAKHLKEEAERGKLPAKVAAAITEAPASLDAVALRTARPSWTSAGSPGGQVLPPRTPMLQPNQERRRTGSHYTPRTLTEPIVRHALEPAFARIGPEATPDAVLALKVCDPAMGSGAFLVEACRQLAARLALGLGAACQGTRPEIPADEDEDLLARRLVAQRCLYGVDRNPMATDLARLSLWLATLARDHEFTFLDHALRTGDSLVGLTRKQIEALDWRDTAQRSLFSSFVGPRVAEAVRERAAIRAAADDVTLFEQEQRFQNRRRQARGVAPGRRRGDRPLLCSSDKPRERAAAAVDRLHEAAGSTAALWTALDAFGRAAARPAR